MNTELVIFDLDGTLLNTLDDLTASVNYAMSVNQMPEHRSEVIRTFVGDGIVNLIKRAVPQNTGQEQFEKALADFKIHYKDNGTKLTAPYPGVIEMLDKLIAGGVKAAVASNKDQTATEEIVTHFFGNRFTMIEGKRDGREVKPHPQILFDILDKTDVSPEKVFFVGDASTDILTGKAAELRCVGVTWGFRSEEDLIEVGADYIINSSEELSSVID